MKRLWMLLVGAVFLVGIASPAWAPLKNTIEKPKPEPQGSGSSSVVDLRDKKSQVPQIPPTPPPTKQEKPAPKK